MAEVGSGIALDVDTEPGDELIRAAGGEVAVHKWSATGLSLIEAAQTPAQVLSPLRVLVGEFDEAPGKDLLVSEKGQWVSLYHLDEQGRPTLVATTTFDEPMSNRAFQSSVAIGPDDSGRWRVIAHYDEAGDGGDSEGDRLALWEVADDAVVDTRLDLPSDACEMYAFDEPRRDMTLAAT